MSPHFDRAASENYLFTYSNRRAEVVPSALLKQEGNQDVLAPALDSQKIYSNTFTPLPTFKIKSIPTGGFQSMSVDCNF